MKIIQKIALRAVALIGLLILFNYIYSAFLFEDDIQKHSSIINLVRDLPGDTDILYIGESSNFTYSEQDKDKRSISAFISDHYPTLIVSDLTKEAAHAGIYKTLLKEIPKSSSIKTIVVTLNLRSFSAGWIYSNLETSLQKSMVLLQDNPPLYNRILLSFKGYDVKSEKERNHQMKAKWKCDHLIFPTPFPHENVREWDDWMAETGMKDSHGIYDSIQTDLACHFIKTYAFQIDTLSHPRISDFDEIIALAKKRRWNLVFNLLAENTEKAEELVGEELVFLMNQNRTLLMDYFSNKGVTVVDNLNSVKDEFFIDRTWTTEHYAEEGRRRIAKNVAQSLLKFYPNNKIP